VTLVAKLDIAYFSVALDSRQEVIIGDRVDRTDGEGGIGRATQPHLRDNVVI